MKKVGHLPATVQRKIVQQVSQIGARRATRKASKNLEKAQETVDRRPNTAQETLQTGVGAAQDALGKGTQGVDKDKETQGADNEQSDSSQTQSRLRTGFSAAKNVLGKGRQRASKSLKRAHKEQAANQEAGSSQENSPSTAHVLEFLRKSNIINMDMPLKTLFA